MDVDRKELVAALRRCKQSVSSRPGIPALTGVRMHAEGGQVELVTTDLEVSLRTAVIGTWEVGEEEWEALVPFSVLAESVKSGPERVKIGPEGASAFRAGAAIIRLLPLEDFPALQDPSDGWFNLEAASLLEAFKRVEPFATKDEARPVLTGVLLEVEEAGGLVLAATDSYRLAASDALYFSGGAPAAGKWIVPARVLRAAVKIACKHKPGTALLSLRFGDDWQVGLEMPNGDRLTSRIIEGEFPNWRQLVPEAYGNRWEYDRAALLGAIAQAGPFCRDTVPMRFAFDAALPTRIAATAPDLGTFSTELAGTYSGESLSVAFNPFYLRGAVEATDGGPMEVRDGLKPAVLRGAGLTALVMPVRMPAAVDVTGNGGVPGVGVDAPHEPSAEERAAGAEVSEPEPPAVEPEPEPEPPWERCSHGYGNGEGCSECAPAEPADCGEGPGCPLHGDGSAPGVSVDVPDGSELAERIAQEAVPSGEWAELAVIGEVPSGRGSIRVRLVVAPNGRAYVDVRRFGGANGYTGRTAKGLAVPAELAGTVGELLEAASDYSRGRE